MGRARTARYATHCSRTATIVARLVNACWYCFKLVVGVALVGAAAIGVYMYVRMDDEIRRHIEAMLAEKYPYLHVSVGGARVVEGRGIAVYDVSLADPAAIGRRGQLLLIDELMLVCDVELTALVKGAPDVRRVEVKHPQAFLERGPAGKWNLAALLPSAPCGGACPQIVVRDGVLSVGDPAAGAPPLALREIQLTIGAAGAAARAGDWPSLHIDGTLGGPHVRRAEIHAALDGARRRCTAVITLDRMALSDPLLAWVRPLLPPMVHSTSVTGLVDGKLTLDWPGAGPPQAKGTFTLSDGRLIDPWLPQPVTELTGRVVVDGATLQVEQLTGKCGAAAVAASLNRNGWAATAPLALSARAEGVPLDDRLYQTLAAASNDTLRPGMLPRLLREQWDKFLPAGVVDATLQATFDGGAWAPTATLTGRQLSFESDKFRYRLTDGSGTIRFTPRTGDTPALLDLDVVGYGGGQPLHIVGRVFDPRPLAAGWAEITGQDVEIEKRMIDALEPKPREVIASLNPTGKMNVLWRIERTAPGEEPRTTMQLDLADVRINYAKFPYPVRHIRGALVAQGNEWTFRDLISAGRPTIRGEGYLRPIGEGAEFSLRITADQAPLNEDLFEALPPPVQQAWRQLQPRGEIDLTADVFYRTGQAAPNIHAEISPRPESAQFRPVFFPYLLEQVSGTIDYQDGVISLAEVRARHDRTAIRTNGNGYFAPDGQWQMRLVGLTADRLTPSQDLLSALPKPLSKLIERLQPTGAFSLSNGVLAFHQSASAIAALESEWDLQLDCHQADLRCGIDLQNIHGSVRLAGQSNGERSFSAGDLALETVTFQDVQFTNVRGPLWVDQSRCLLGRWATDQQQQAPRHLTGGAYGGAFNSDAWVTFDTLPQYRVEAALTGADLNRLLLERSGGQHNLGGKLDADLRLNGNGYKVESLVGDGHIHVREANIGELPLLVSMLKVMRTGSSNKSAFDKCEVAFKLQGRHIYLEQVDFLGDAVNLYGKGETNFDQQLNLVFSPSVARNDSYFPMMKSLIGQANQQIMQMYVTGTLSQPQVTREAFPKINQMLQQVRQDLEDPVGSAERQAQRGIEIGEPSRQ